MDWDPEGMRMRPVGDAGGDGDVYKLGGYKTQPGRQQNGDEEGEDQKLGPFSAL